MSMTSKITITKPAAEVWHVLADEFVPLEKWMAAITHSEEKTDGVRAPGAPVIGRKAHIGAVPGSYMDETITSFDADAMKLSVHTILANQSAPLKGFDYEVTVVSKSENESEVIWESKPHLRPLGYLMYPVIAKGLNAGFYRGLEELKCYVETGPPHKRTLDNKAKWGIKV